MLDPVGNEVVVTPQAKVIEKVGEVFASALKRLAQQQPQTGCLARRGSMGIVPDAPEHRSEPCPVVLVMLRPARTTAR